MNEPRCKALDADGCRCMRREHPPQQPHDFSYTPFRAVVTLATGERVVIDGARFSEGRWVRI